jgi:hypothetical protein
MRDDTIKDKADHVSKVLPQISEEGQEYLKNVAQALLLVQNPAVSPLTGKHEQDAKTSEESP